MVPATRSSKPRDRRDLLRSGVGKRFQLSGIHLAGASSLAKILQRYPKGFASKLAPTNRTTPPTGG